MTVACIGRDAHEPGGWERIETVVRDHVRPEDLLARWDAETLVLAFPRCDAALARSIVERIREALVLRQLEDREAPRTISSGIADSSQGSELATLLVHADEALAAARRAGGNRAVIGGWVSRPYTRVPTRASILTRVAR